MREQRPGPRGVSLCSGGGGLDIAIQALGVRTVGYVEINPYAQAVLHARMRDGWLDSAPLWPDLTTLAGPAVLARCGVVDFVYGGIPCQPHSRAGERKGHQDERDLWPATRRLVGEIRPSLVLLENVDGIRTRNGDEPAYAWRIAADLAGMGYMGRWVVVSAAEVGAPHQRARWFVLAHTGRPCFDPLQQESERWRRGSPPAGEGGDSVAGMEHANGARCLEGPEQPLAGGTAFTTAGLPSCFPPAPFDRERWAAILGKHPELAPALESGFRGGPDGLAAGMDRHRRHSLELLGNGVVPHQAVLAMAMLLAVTPGGRRP